MNLSGVRAPWAAASLFAFISLAAACASAGPAPETGGFTVTDTDLLIDVHNRNRVAGLEDRRFDHDTYWNVVLPLLEGSTSLGHSPAGISAEGRPIRVVTYGEGPVPVLLWSQMHGNESTASMALADIFAFLRREPNHPIARNIRQGTALHIIPMLNPDGAERFQRRNAQGIDINRDARALATPESRTLKSVRDQVQPAFAFNLHDQGAGTRVGDSDRGVAIALLSPPFDETRQVNEVRAAAIEVAGVIQQAMNPLVPGHIARYDDTFNPRAFGDLITQWGASTVLIESGGWLGDPQKQYLRTVNFVGILAALNAIATGSHKEVPPSIYTSLPMNGRRIADLKMAGGTLVIPGLVPVDTDVLVNYEDNLAHRGGEIADIGDLAEVEAQDTLDLTGLFLHPLVLALDRSSGAQLQPGAAAHFRITEDREGDRVLWIFEGAPPEEGFVRR